MGGGGSASSGGFAGWGAHSVDVGGVRQGEVLEHTFRVVNESGRAVAIDSVRTSCGCTVVDAPSGVVRPGGTIDVPVRFDTAGKLSDVDQWVVVGFGGAVPDLVLRLSATVVPEFTVSPAVAEVVLRPGQVEVRQLRVRNCGVSDIDSVRIAVATQGVVPASPPQVVAKPCSWSPDGSGGLCRQLWEAGVCFDAARLRPGRHTCVLDVLGVRSGVQRKVGSAVWTIVVKPGVQVGPGRLFLDFSAADEQVRDVKVYYWDERFSGCVPEFELSPGLPVDVEVEHVTCGERGCSARLRFSADAGLRGTVRGDLSVRVGGSASSSGMASVLALGRPATHRREE